MVTTTTWSMREFPGFGRLGRTARADVTLLKGHDAPNAAAPEASARFFTNSRRFIFTRTLRDRNRRRARCKSTVAAEGGFTNDCRKQTVMCKRQVKNHQQTTKNGRGRRVNT